MRPSPYNPGLPVVLYVLEDPREPGHLRYIGQTTSPGIRFRTHVCRGSDGCAAPVAKWVQKLLAEGVQPRMRVLTSVVPLLADETERRLILAYRRLGCELLNVQAGGTSGYPQTEAQRRGSRKGASATADMNLKARARGRMLDHSRKFYAPVS